MNRAIRKVLIANRGEIACRIMRTARARGVRTVAVYSDADADASYVRLADEAVHIGGAPASESYLNISAVIAAAKKTKVDAIHPGYGFLSERAEFAQCCHDSGLIFIGPTPEAIAAMGDKGEAKRRVIAAGVPCVPGYQNTEQSDTRLQNEAERIGFPLMVKACAGGGGRGLRLVARAEDLKEALLSARREAKNAFGDDRLLIEKAIVGARHVEIQILADVYGAVVHLGERDCSLQRRRQKVIEEAPSPVISAEIRAAMGQAAIEAARAVNYRGAGTVEFLYDPKANAFYFLEMNTRLQVEHPVTECVTGLDLVGLQFDIAEGKPLALTQDDVRLNGWAMEARLYAEEPARDFLPQTGAITALQFPKMKNVRIDSGVEAGDEVSAYYDPMIAKLIAYGNTRDEARERLASALENTILLGFSTNGRFLVSLLRDGNFAAGGAGIDYIEENLERLAAPAPSVRALEIALVAATLMDFAPGDLLAGWNSRGRSAFPLKLQYGEECISVVAEATRSAISARLGEESAEIEIIERDSRGLRFRHDGAVKSACLCRSGDAIDVWFDGISRRFIDITYAPAGEAGPGGDIVKAPMAGSVTAVLVKAGDTVRKGDVIATIEAMKMEHKLTAPRDGVVAAVLAAPGDQVAIRTTVVALESGK